MQTNKIAIIGNGNLGTSIYNGFMNYHNTYGSDNVFLLGRSYFDSDPREAPISEQQMPLTKFNILILAVKPIDAIKTLMLLRGKLGPNTIVISFISGLSMNLISIVLQISNHDIVTATSTTNVAYGEGFIVFNTPSYMGISIINELFKPMSKEIIEVRGNKIIKAVVWEAAANAIYFKHIKLKAEKTNSSFADFLKNLNMKDAGVQNFIAIQDEACRKFFGKDCFVKESYEYALNTVKKSCTSLDDIETLITQVATPKGCTAEGVDLFADLKKMRVDLFLMILNKIYRKALTFSKTINVDFEKLNLPIVESRRQRKGYLHNFY